jgi:hypothetical protein
MGMIIAAHLTFFIEFTSYVTPVKPYLLLIVCSTFFTV